MVDSTLAASFVLLGLVGIVAAVFALRHRLAFRIALRNVRRGRGRTVLLLLGLLVGTTIISGSLIVGSTVQALDVHYTYLGSGYVHESISATGPSGGLAPFPYSVYTAISVAAEGQPDIAGITPMVITTTQVYDRTTGIPETNLNLIASNANQSGNLGTFVSTSGATLPGPSGSEVYVDLQTAEALNASVGDAVVVYGPHPVDATIGAIVQDNLRGGFITAGLTPGNVFVDLPTAQFLVNISGQINYIAVTNTGTQAGGIALSDSVSHFLNTTLASIPAAAGLSVTEDMKNNIAAAELSGTSVQTIFLVLGLFSIVAGAMLIVGIFVMLAEERKGEMGMLRAIGMRRRELVFVYYFEGLIYAVGSALAGTLLGVVVGYLLTYVFSTLFASGALTATAILQSFTVTPDDLVISYVAGFLLTLITVAVASSRVSRLNIVQAIRDLPSPPPPRRWYTLLGYLGGLLAVGGVVLLVPNLQGTSDISVPILGGGFIILGLGLVASRFVANRLAFSAVGAGLLVWAGVEPLHRLVFGTTHSGGIFLLFVEGILMVAGALLLYIFNSAAFLGGILRLAGQGSRGAPVARVGLSYPARLSGSDRHQPRHLRAGHVHDGRDRVRRRHRPGEPQQHDPGGLGRLQFLRVLDPAHPGPPRHRRQQLDPVRAVRGHRAAGRGRRQRERFRFHPQPVHRQPVLAGRQRIGHFELLRHQPVPVRVDLGRPVPDGRSGAARDQRLRGRRGQQLRPHRVRGRVGVVVAPSHPQRRGPDPPAASGQPRGTDRPGHRDLLAERDPRGLGQPRHRLRAGLPQRRLVLPHGPFRGIDHRRRPGREARVLPRGPRAVRDRPAARDLDRLDGGGHRTPRDLRRDGARGRDRGDGDPRAPGGGRASAGDRDAPVDGVHPACRPLGVPHRVPRSSPSSGSRSAPPSGSGSSGTCRSAPAPPRAG